jgi:hypothetical protein
MWDYEYQVTTSATPQAIYALWSNVESWPSWSADVISAKLDGPFAVGSHILVTTSQNALRLRLAEVRENVSLWMKPK